VLLLLLQIATEIFAVFPEPPTRVNFCVKKDTMQNLRKDMAEEILTTSGKIWSIWPLTCMHFENF